jgi:hypothetical protein
MNMEDLFEIAYNLAKTYGYRYAKSAEYTVLSHYERLRVQNMVMFILKMER